MLGRVQRRHPDRLHRIDAAADRLAHEMVDQAFAQDLADVLVVDAEAAAARGQAALGRDPDQLGQVAHAGALPDHQPQPEPEALDRLVERDRLVVRLGAGRGVGVEPPVREARHAAIDALALPQRKVDPAPDLGLVAQHLVEQHQLAQTDDIVAPSNRAMSASEKDLRRRRQLGRVQGTPRRPWRRT